MVLLGTQALVLSTVLMRASFAASDVTSVHMTMESTVFCQWFCHMQVCTWQMM